MAPGVKDVDGEVKRGDEVVVLQKKKLFGVGVATMNGSDMKKLNYGEAIKTRHHA